VLLASEHYISKWIQWWQAINPNWHEQKGLLFAQTGIGNWSPLMKSGVNGWLTVFTSMLSLLHPAIADPAIWSAAVRDISWSIYEVLKASKA
jgi:hypothetical protein